ncbi:polysaccharide deacetylase family protein [Candidatus Saccharibacteria bacterium]|nr:MAG: polysaccharide deacetylase family protein [Candidatus Saccharibacteria bacterium]
MTKGFKPTNEHNVEQRRWPAIALGVTLVVGAAPAYDFFVKGDGGSSTVSAYPGAPNLADAPVTIYLQPAKPVDTAPSNRQQTPVSTTPSKLVCPPPVKQPIKYAPGQGKTVALTFDDGPGNATMDVLTVLQREGVKATFFVTGENVKKFPNEISRLAAAGMQVANHSYDHRYPTQVMGGWTPAFLQSQLKQTEDALTGLTGKPDCFFRPPGGFQTNVISASNKLGKSVVMWSVDTLDYRQSSRTTEASTAAIHAAATKVNGINNPIVLFHTNKASGEPESELTSNRSNTVAALPGIISWYREKGFSFVTVMGQ